MVKCDIYILITISSLWPSITPSSMPSQCKIVQYNAPTIFKLEWTPALNYFSQCCILVTMIDRHCKNSHNPRLIHNKNLFFFFFRLRNFPSSFFLFSPEFSLSVLPHWSLRCLLVCGSDIVQSLPCKVGSSVPQTQNSRRFVSMKYVFLSSCSAAYGVATRNFILKVCS